MFTLRDYQKRIIDAVGESEFDKICIQSPTGSGKTVMFSKIAADEISRGGFVLCLSHREELIKQAFATSFNLFGLEGSLIKNGVDSDLSKRLQIASVQTLKSWIRRGKADFLKKVTLIITDEAHRAKGKSYLQIYEQAPQAKALGFTATPVRLDGSPLCDIYDDIIVGPTPGELELSGKLCPPRVKVTPISGFELNKIKNKYGDYDERQLAQMMLDNKLVVNAVKAYKDNAPGTLCLAFAVNIEHSKKLVERFNEAGIAAVHVDGTTKNRGEIIARFKRREFLVLSNVGVFTEGTDIPEIETILGARPTKSLSLYIQMTGRGSRPCEAINKKDYIYLDLGNNYLEHGAPNSDRNWKKIFRKKKKARKRFVFGIELSSKKLFTARDIPPSVEVDLVDLGEIESAPVIMKALKKYGAEKLKIVSFKKIAHAVASEYRRVIEFREVVLIAELLGETMTTAESWARFIKIK